MSAFAVIFDHSNRPVDPEALDHVMGRLNHRGPDGFDVCLDGNIAMGHWHFWTTPEEMGENQPLKLDGLPIRIVFDGRIDNRSELIQKLNLTARGKTQSDAKIVLMAYAQWGENCLEHFVGEFALVIYDQNRNIILCARDPMGDRTLFYANVGSTQVIASEPWAVAGAINTIPEINEYAISHYFAFQIPRDGQTLFKNISELIPGHVMVQSQSEQRIWRYWQPDLSKKVHYKNDNEYAEHYLALLEESVRCRMRSNTPVGVFMSGGLDSTSVASLAARMIAPEPLTALSYVFDEFKECDERAYINAVKDQWNLYSIQIPCDDAWPFQNIDKWIANPSQIGGNIYNTIKERMYKNAQNEGFRVVLSGGFGDHLHSAGTDWLIDLILDGYIREVVNEIIHHIRAGKSQRIFNAAMLQRIPIKIIKKVHGKAKLHRHKAAPEWLTLLSTDYILNGNCRVDKNEKQSRLINLVTTYGNSRDSFGHFNIETRYPFRDRRLIEFVLQLPSYQIYTCGRNKHVLRTAMSGILPEMVRTRNNKTSLVPLFSYGIKREKRRLKSFYKDNNAAWCKFVSTDWIEKNWNAFADKDIPQTMVPALCLAYEIWYKSIVQSLSQGNSNVN